MIQQNISSNCFSMLKKKEKKPEEFDTRRLFLTIYFYFFISYQMHVLQVQRMSEVSINNLLPWFMNHAINDLCYCEVKSSPTTSKLLLAIVHFDCKLTFLRAEERLIASPVLQAGAMLCQEDELHYLWQGTLLQKEHQLTALWVQLARQLPRFNFIQPHPQEAKPWW